MQSQRSPTTRQNLQFKQMQIYRPVTRGQVSGFSLSLDQLPSEPVPIELQQDNPQSINQNQLNQNNQHPMIYGQQQYNTPSEFTAFAQDMRNAAQMINNTAVYYQNQPGIGQNAFLYTEKAFQDSHGDIGNIINQLQDTMMSMQQPQTSTQYNLAYQQPESLTQYYGSSEYRYNQSNHQYQMKPSDFARLLEQDAEQLGNSLVGNAVRTNPQYQPVESIIELTNLRDSRLLVSCVGGLDADTQISFEHSTGSKYFIDNGKINESVPVVPQIINQEEHEEGQHEPDFYQGSIIIDPIQQQKTAVYQPQDVFPSKKQSIKSSLIQDVSNIEKSPHSRQPLSQNQSWLSHHTDGPDVNLDQQMLASSELQRQQQQELKNNPEVSQQDYQDLDQIEKVVQNLEVQNHEEQIEFEYAMSEEQQRIDTEKRRQQEEYDLLQSEIELKQQREVVEMRNKLEKSKESLNQLLIKESPISKPDNLKKIEELERQLMKRQLSPLQQSNPDIGRRIDAARALIRKVRVVPEEPDLVQQIEDMKRQQQVDLNHQQLKQAELRLELTINDLTLKKGNIFDQRIASPPRDLAVFGQVQSDFQQMYESAKQAGRSLASSQFSERQKGLYHQLENAPVADSNSVRSYVAQTINPQSLLKSSDDQTDSLTLSDAKKESGERVQKYDLIAAEVKKKSQEQFQQMLQQQSQQLEVQEKRDPLAIRRSYVKSSQFPIQRQENSPQVQRQMTKQPINLNNDHEEAQNLYMRAQQYSHELSKGLNELKLELSQDEIPISSDELKQNINEQLRLIDQQELQYQQSMDLQTDNLYQADQSRRYGKYQLDQSQKQQQDQPIIVKSKKRIIQKPENPNNLTNLFLQQQVKEEQQETGAETVDLNRQQQSNQEIANDSVQARKRRHNTSQRSKQNVITVDNLNNVDRSNLDIQSSRLEDDKIISESPQRRTSELLDTSIGVQNKKIVQDPRRYRSGAKQVDNSRQQIDNKKLDLLRQQNRSGDSLGVVQKPTLQKQNDSMSQKDKFSYDVQKVQPSQFQSRPYKPENIFIDKAMAAGVDEGSTQLLKKKNSQRIQQQVRGRYPSPRTSPKIPVVPDAPQVQLMPKRKYR